MSRWFHWRQVLSRLLLVLIVILGGQYLLGLAGRKFAERTGEQVLGAKVDVANARVSLAKRQLVLSDLRVAHPFRPEEPLLHADRWELDIAVEPLLHKRAVVDGGRITGLRVGARNAPDGATSNEIAPAAAPAYSWFRDDADALTREWLAHLTERFHHDFTEELESLRRSESLCADWPQQCAAWKQRANELRERAWELQQQTDAALSNRLRHADYLAALPDQLHALHEDMAALQSDLADVPALLDDQREAILAARRQDEKLLRERLRVESIGADALSGYLLRGQLSQALDQLIAWLAWAREIVPAEPRLRPATGRGEDVLFAGCRPAPNLLIRMMQIEGAIGVGGREVKLHGTLTDFADRPSLHDIPLRLRLASNGSLPLDVHATIDRTGPVARDELLIDCRGLAVPELRLGSDQLQLLLGPSHGSLSISVSLEGEALAGDIQLVQREVRLAPVLQGELSAVPLGALLEATLGNVGSIAARLSLAGTLDEPTCTLWSNLGPAVAEAMHRALQRAAEQHRRAILADAQRQVDERLAKLAEAMLHEQQALASQLAGVNGQLQSIARQQTPRDRISVERLGGRLPETSLFR